MTTQLSVCFVVALFLSIVAAHSSLASASSSAPPNVVFVLADDLDLTLGGFASVSLSKTRRLLGGNQGCNLPNWFVHTPVCCPSRAELLTGRTFHNLKVPQAAPKRWGCMHVDVSSNVSCAFYSEYYFARHFARLGYTVGIFGKHLNNENPPGPPPGVDRWLVNGGGDYNDPSFYWASSGVEPTTVHFNNCTDGAGQQQPCYSTSVIGNASLSWIRDHISSGQSEKPFFAYVAVKAPHIQDGPNFPMAIPAPWYANASVGPRALAPRTPNYNVSCPDHHWMVRHQDPLTGLVAEKVDELYVSRLRTLLSVDDLVEGIVSTLDELSVLQNTYILFTSDNGYRLGQFRMPIGKFHPYENDVRVPFLIRGPGIRCAPGSSVRSDILGTHVDIMPTLLGLVQSRAPLVRGGGGDNGRGVAIPSTMDGENLAPLLLDGGVVDGAGGWRHSPHQRRTAVLIEYIGLGDVVRYGHLEDAYNNTFRALRIINDAHPVGRRNLKYVEFTDCQRDWNFTDEPKEVELFDLDDDPFELINIASRVPRGLLERLRSATRRLFTCKGPTCRESAAEATDIRLETS